MKMCFHILLFFQKQNFNNMNVLKNGWNRKRLNCKTANDTYEYINGSSWDGSSEKRLNVDDSIPDCSNADGSSGNISKKCYTINDNFSYVIFLPINFIIRETCCDFFNKRSWAFLWKFLSLDIAIIGIIVQFVVFGW